MGKILLLSFVAIFRYFIPFVYVSQEEFNAQCGEHDVYYELCVDSIGNEYENTRLVSNDSILHTFVYKACYKADSSWFEPIRAKVDSLEKEILETKDKEAKKRIQGSIDWLKERYY